MIAVGMVLVSMLECAALQSIQRRLTAPWGKAGTLDGTDSVFPIMTCM